MAGVAGSRVLIVGASSGIGRAVARAASAAGAIVALSARRSDELEAAAAQCTGKAFSVVGDVRSAEDCRRVVEESVALLGGLDSVVYATGASQMALVCDTDGEEWRRILETNVIGAALVFAAAEAELTANRGQLLVLSSASRRRPKAGLVAYAASKAALEKLIEGLRTEHPEVAFTVVTVGPTSGTEFARDFDPAVAEQLMDRWRAAGSLAPGSMTSEDVADRIVECLGSPVRTEELFLLPRP
jgi:NAD(P)-dependent dehydrogenase (short-subunit alcohol dehydrogenase family)